jgi:hypothetical protein
MLPKAILYKSSGGLSDVQLYMPKAYIQLYGTAKETEPMLPNDMLLTAPKK